MIGVLISSLFGLGTEYVKGKAEEKKEKLLIKRESNQAISASNKQREHNTSTQQQSLTALDAVTAKQIGWLDDFVIVLTMSLVVSLFIPWSAEYAQAGIDNMNKAPLWFQYAVGSVYIYVFGFKGLVYRLLVKRGI